MTTAYEPTPPLYLDDADVGGELTRVFDICQGCRRCSELCGSFPTLFALIGPVATFVFENGDTIRFKILEMARVEKLRSPASSSAVASRDHPADAETVVPSDVTHAEPLGDLTT